VTSIVNLGSHDWFIGEVVWMHLDEDVAAGSKDLAWNPLAVIHERRRRCGYCGSSRLQAVTVTGGAPLVSQPAKDEAENLEPFTCQECGHLEWFIK
jgi:hypothetical protein